MSTIYVYGAGGHGKVVADAAVAAGMEVRGFIDDGHEVTVRGPLGLPVVGGGAWLTSQEAPADVSVALGIGDNRARHVVSERLAAAGIAVVTVIHPRATVAPSATIAAGTVLFAGAVANADATIGGGVIVNTGAIVEHDCIVGDFAHLAPNATMGGGARLGARAWLGLGASIIHGGSVGADSIIGANAAVVREIPPCVVAIGVPAKVSHPVELST